jgi:RimJ/RimL family protein N-acetyltransferase
MEAKYPTELVHRVRLSGGAHLWIRPIRADDERRLLRLFDHLSTSSRHQRFFTPLSRLPTDWVHHFANVDYQERLALVAERDVEGDIEIGGVARYEPTGEPVTREIAVAVEDRWHRQGLGTILLGDLLHAADVRGIQRFRAFVLAENQGMLRLIARFGEVVDKRVEEGVVEIVFTRRAPGQGTGRAR